MRRRFPKTATPPRVSLNCDILEDRLPVSEQVGTLVAVLLYTGVEPLVRHQVAHLSSAAPAPLGLNAEMRETAVPPGVTPPERIALVPAAAYRRADAAPLAIASARPVWKADSLNPALAGAPDQEPFALDLTLPPLHHVRGGSAGGFGADTAPAVAATGSSGGVAPDGGISRGPVSSGVPAAGAQPLANASLSSSILGNLPPTAAGTSTATPVTDLSSGTATNGNQGTPPPPGHPPFVPPRHPPHRNTDPVDVLDANNAIVLNQNVSSTTTPATPSACTPKCLGPRCSPIPGRGTTRPITPT